MDVLSFVLGVVVTLVAWGLSNYRQHRAMERDYDGAEADPDFQPIRCRTCGFYRRYF